MIVPSRKACATSTRNIPDGREQSRPEAEAGGGAGGRADNDEGPHPEARPFT